jgi:hypothetical protein
MRCFENLVSEVNSPALISNFKQTERRLLSVFMCLLDLSPAVRGHFLDLCGFRGAKTSNYKTLMEVSYKGSKFSEIRPDGLLACKRGATTWSAYIEAKAEKMQIRPEQIQSYLELAKLTDVDAIITISNEFARIPSELPYHMDSKKVGSKQVLHFAWADIRTVLELAKENLELETIEVGILKECLRYFWDEKSGITTYDRMPEKWPAFVEASSTALGLNTNVKGLSEVIYGWEQERRDLCSKLTRDAGTPVEIRHLAGIRASVDERAKVDKTQLATNYTLGTKYFYKQSKLTLELLVDLRACRMTAALELPIPADKGAKALTTWCSKILQDFPEKDALICFDWPGKDSDVSLSMGAFLTEPTMVSDGKKTPPRGVKVLTSRHGVRNFKSRKKFILDIEDMTLQLAGFAKSQSWV